MAELLAWTDSESGDYGSRLVGQSFTPDAAWIVTSVATKVHVITAAANVTCDIYADGGSEAPTGSSLGTSDAQECSTTPGTVETFTWSPGVALTSGQKYWLIWGGANNAYVWREDGNHTLSQKLGYSADDNPLTGWTVDPGNGYCTANLTISGTLAGGVISGRRGFTTRSGILFRRR